MTPGVDLHTPPPRMVTGCSSFYYLGMGRVGLSHTRVGFSPTASPAGLVHLQVFWATGQGTFCLDQTLGLLQVPVVDRAGIKPARGIEQVAGFEPASLPPTRQVFRLPAYHLHTCPWLDVLLLCSRLHYLGEPKVGLEPTPVH